MKINLLQSSFVKLLCVALLGITVSGCTPKDNAEAEKAATAAARLWLVTIDHGDYAQSWQNASALFQSAVTEEKWKTALEAVRKPLGDLESRKFQSAKVTAELPGAPAGQYVVMQFNTAFANMNRATETVTFSLEKDGQWKSIGYFIK